MELINKNYRAFICDISNYEDVIKIYRSRPFIQGSPRNLAADEKFEKHLAEILLGNKPEFLVVGVEEIDTKILVSFATYTFPNNSQFGFMKIGGTLPRSKSLATYVDTGAIPLLRLGVMIAESKGIFDIFWSVKLSSYLPMCKLFNYSGVAEDLHRSYWMLHKVIQPDEPLVTSIDKFLLETPLVKRLYPIAIMHTSLKEEHRIAHYKNHFGVSEETIKRCTVPGYACSTSTITSLATSS